MKTKMVYGEDIKVVLVHGGPGDRGGLSDLAWLLSERVGVLEIYQSSLSITQLVEDMNEIIREHCDAPVVLLGHSWGAWLVSIFAQAYPLLVKKIILVSSGSFTNQYGKVIQEIRNSRLTEEKQMTYDRLMKAFSSENTNIKDQAMAQLGTFFAELDAYDYLACEDKINSQPSFEMYQNIWAEASEMRECGLLLDLAKKITVPIHVIQGDFDSHTLEGVIKPFKQHGINYTFDLLEKCGHYPWRETFAKDIFLGIVLRHVL